MTGARRLILGLLFTIWLGTVIACTGTTDRKNGGASQPKADGDPQQPNEAVNLGAAEKAQARAKARADAEAEAAAKNDAQREAYEAEVERLKTAHEKRLDTYQAAKETYKKALPIYEAAQQEYDAAKMLNLARAFHYPKEMEIARRRYRDIVKVYPETQSAKDAKILLNDGYVSARKVPAEPIPPVIPVQPRLVLPLVPTPVAVVYPPDPEDIAAAPLLNESDIPDGEFKSAKAGDYQTPIRLASGKTVYVRGYVRANGTYVAPHMRSEPGSGTKAGTGGKRR